MAESRIEWTEMTWNPVTGCTKVSSGCAHCYAETMARRLKAMGAKKYKNGFRVSLHPETLADPYRWKKPRTVFVNSMSDLLHKDVPTEFIEDIFQVMKDCRQHRFQVLTKRSSRLLEINERLEWPTNVWMGVSVENGTQLDRIAELSSSGAHVKFLSLEPLLGPLPDLSLDGIHWVIAGGESGPRARPIEQEWVLDIRDQCSEAGVPFFFKQWGGKNKKKTGRLLEGKLYDEMPAIAA